MKAPEDEPMSGAEFKMHTTDGEKIHQSATTHLMELWPGATRKFCGKLLIATERELESGDDPSRQIPGRVPQAHGAGFTGRNHIINLVRKRHGSVVLNRRATW